MDFEDLLEPEVAVGAAVAAAIFSPRVRGLLRKGAVYGLAGALMAGDAVAEAAKNARAAVQQASATAAKAAQQRTSANGAAGETTQTQQATEQSTVEVGG